MKKIVLLVFIFGITGLTFTIRSQQKRTAESASEPSAFKGKTVLLDAYYNNEWRKDATGNQVRYHYTWDDKNNSGFSQLGELFRAHGAQTKYLESAPTAKKLKKAAIYIIVDPDTEKETATPNYIDKAAAGTVADWVRSGGVLLLMGNDAGNAELKSLNVLASEFGIHFNEDNFNLVPAGQFEQGAIKIPAGHSIFRSAKKIFIKELSTLQVSNPAATVLTKDGKNIMAVAKYGKGTVFAIGDPWLYNEYIDHRHLPVVFDNLKAAEDLVEWLLAQNHKR